MEAEWRLKVITDLISWKAELALWDEPNVGLKCQSVHQNIVFLPSNSLHNLGGLIGSCQCYHPQNFKQIN